MTTATTHRLLLVASLVVAIPGCVQYRRMHPGDLRPGERAAVSLTPSGAAALASAVGPRVTRLDGRVVASSDSALTVAVSSIVRHPYQEETWPGESVRVPLAAVDLVRVRRIDAKRSTTLALASALGFLATRAIIDAALVDRGRRVPPPPAPR